MIGYILFVPCAGLRQLLPTIAALPDSCILRWYRSKQGKFDETADGLRKHVVFRKAWRLDDLDSYEPSEILEKYCGYGLLPDKEGNPVLMSLIGNMDVEGSRFEMISRRDLVNSPQFTGMLRSVQSREYIQFSLAAIEKGVELCNQRALQVGPFYP
jgi:hypothetical protein